MHHALFLDALAGLLTQCLDIGGLQKCQNFDTAIFQKSSRDIQ